MAAKRMKHGEQWVGKREPEVDSIEQDDLDPPTHTKTHVGHRTGRLPNRMSQEDATRRRLEGRKRRQAMGSELDLGNGFKLRLRGAGWVLDCPPRLADGEKVPPLYYSGPWELFRHYQDAMEGRGCGWVRRPLDFCALPEPTVTRVDQFLERDDEAGRLTLVSYPDGAGKAGYKYAEVKCGTHHEQYPTSPAAVIDCWISQRLLFSGRRTIDEVPGLIAEYAGEIDPGARHGHTS